MPLLDRGADFTLPRRPSGSVCKLREERALPNRDSAPTYDLGPSFLIENSPDYPRAVEELYCASMAEGSDRRSFAADVVAIAGRYGFEGDQPQTLLLDVVMELVSFVRSALSLEARSVLEEVVAERAMIARLADDLENFEDGDR